MIDTDVIDKTILELEGHDTTFATIEKLAMLYTVKDHISPTSAAVLRTSARSEFLNALEGKDPVEVWDIVDEHMNLIKNLYPREYDGIIRKLNELVIKRV